MKEKDYDEIIFDENEQGSHCIQCGKFFKFYELQLYRRINKKNEYICLNCGEVFKD